jgi:hypothetical protein
MNADDEAEEMSRFEDALGDLIEEGGLSLGSEALLLTATDRAGLNWAKYLPAEALGPVVSMRTRSSCHASGVQQNPTGARNCPQARQ